MNEEVLQFNAGLDMLLDRSTSDKPNSQHRYTTPPTRLARVFLTLKAHKNPMKFRCLTSMIGTPIAALARCLGAALGTLTPVVNFIWQQIALAAGFRSTGSWIVQQSADIMQRLRYIRANKECRAHVRRVCACRHQITADTSNQDVFRVPVWTCCITRDREARATARHTQTCSSFGHCGHHIRQTQTGHDTDTLC